MSGRVIKNKQEYLEEAFKLLQERFKSVKVKGYRTISEQNQFDITDLYLYSHNKGTIQGTFIRNTYPTRHLITMNIEQLKGTYTFLAVLLHEMVHCYSASYENHFHCGCHQGVFVDIGKQVGLKPKWASTFSSNEKNKELYPFLEEIVEQLGELPEENGQVYTKRELDAKREL